MTRFGETQGGAIYGEEGSDRGTRTYFDVDDINAGAARVAELGGEAGEAMPVPSDGLVRDLQGQPGERVRPLADRPERAGRVGHSSCGAAPRVPPRPRAARC